MWTELVTHHRSAKRMIPSLGEALQADLIVMGTIVMGSISCAWNSGTVTDHRGFRAVIPAKAGIRKLSILQDPGFHRGYEGPWNGGFSGVALATCCQCCEATRGKKTSWQPVADATPVHPVAAWNWNISEPPEICVLSPPILSGLKFRILEGIDLYFINYHSNR